MVGIKLEDLRDIEAVKAVKDEESISIEEVRKILLAKGEVSDSDLAKIPKK